MFTKKASPKKIKEATPKQSGSPFAKILASLLLVVLPVDAGLSYWAYNFWVAGKEQQQVAQLSRDYAEKQAVIIQNYFRDARQVLQTFTSREDVIRAVTSDDKNSLARIQLELRRQLPGVRGIRFDARGAIALNPDGDVPINFAELDMINRVSRRETVFPEAVERNGEWRVNIVEAIPKLDSDAATPKPVVATILVSLSATGMLSKLGATNLSQGNILLLQQFGQNKPQPITEIGQDGVGVGQEFTVPQSNWLIRFTPSPGFAEQVAVSATAVVVVLFLIAVVVIAAGVFVAERLSRATVAKNDRIAMTERAAARAKSTDPLGAAPNKKLLEMKVKKEDADILNLKKRSEVDPLDIADTSVGKGDIPAIIFRSYDIRGIVPSQLSPENVVLIGRAIGSQALEAGDKAIFVGRDGRTHGNDVSEQLIEGILSTGCNVINLGMVPTPLVYFAIAELPSCNSGVSVTASHNPAEYNGFKVVINGKTLADNEIKQLHSRIVSQGFLSGPGKEEFTDLSLQYIDKIVSDIAIASNIKVVVDAGNGVAGEFAPRTFDEIGCEVVPLHCKIDGNFPNHEPDPSIDKNLQDLINKVKEVGADLGVALDGDGDRVGIVTATGQIIWPDRLLMLLAKDILARNPGTDVLFDVKCSRELNTVISTYGGRPIMWKSGHSHMKGKMQETQALLGGELSGHIFISERWYGFDDGIYVAARIMEIMSLREQDLDSIFESFPAPPSTPEIKVQIADEKKFGFIKRLVVEGKFDGGRLTTIDGLRVDFENGWGLVRASNTSPALTLRFEADTLQNMEKIQAIFKQEIQKIDPKLALKF